MSDNTAFKKLLEQYNLLSLHCTETELTLATIADMVMGEDVADRSDASLLRAIRTLLNSHKKQAYTITQLQNEVAMLNHVIEIKYTS